MIDSIKAATFRHVLRSSPPRLTPPKMTKEAAEGSIRLHKLTQLAKLAGLDESEMSEMALTDPKIMASLDYEQALAENAALREQVMGMQQQGQQIQQQMQQQDQQLQMAQQQMMQQQQQLEAEQQGRQAATEQAIMAKDSELAGQANMQLHRQQMMAAADDLAVQLKQIAAMPPEQQAMQAAQGAQDLGVQADQSQLMGLPSQLKKQVTEAQRAEQEAGMQAQQAEQTAAQEAAEQQPPPQQGMQVMASEGYLKVRAQLEKSAEQFLKEAMAAAPPSSLREALMQSLPGVGGAAGGAGLGALYGAVRPLSDEPGRKGEKLQRQLDELRSGMEGEPSLVEQAKIKHLESQLASNAATRGDRWTSVKRNAGLGALIGGPVGTVGGRLFSPEVRKEIAAAMEHGRLRGLEAAKGAVE